MMDDDKDRFQELQDVITQWADETFGKDRKPVSILHHLKKEIEELLERPDSLEEYADVGILWLNAADKAGYKVEILFAAMAMKMVENATRKWGTPDQNGVVEHLREKSDDTK